MDKIKIDAKRELEILRLQIKQAISKRATLKQSLKQVLNAQAKQVIRNDIDNTTTLIQSFITRATALDATLRNAEAGMKAEKNDFSWETEKARKVDAFNPESAGIKDQAQRTVRKYMLQLKREKAAIRKPWSERDATDLLHREQVTQRLAAQAAAKADEDAEYFNDQEKAREQAQRTVREFMLKLEREQFEKAAIRKPWSERDATDLLHREQVKQRLAAQAAAKADADAKAFSGGKKSSPRPKSKPPKRKKSSPRS